FITGAADCGNNMLSFGASPNLFGHYSDPNLYPTTWAWGANGSGQDGDGTTDVGLTGRGVLLNNTPLSFTMVDSADANSGTLPPLSDITTAWNANPPAVPSSGYVPIRVTGNEVDMACIDDSLILDRPSDAFLSYLASHLTGLVTHTTTFPNYLTGQT